MCVDSVPVAFESSPEFFEKKTIELNYFI